MGLIIVCTRTSAIHSRLFVGLFIADAHQEVHQFSRDNQHGVKQMLIAVGGGGGDFTVAEQRHIGELKMYKTNINTI